MLLRVLLALAFIVLAGRLVPAQHVTYVPQVVTGEGQGFLFQTIFKLLDQSGQDNDFTIELIRDDGEPLNGFLQRNLLMPFVNRVSGSLNGFGNHESRTDLNVPFGVPVTGWARITTAQPVSVVVVLRSFNLEDFSVATATGLIPEPPTDAFSSFADDLKPGRLEQIGIAILNLSESESVTVRFDLAQIDGSEGGSRTIQIGPGQKIAQFLNEAPLFTDVDTLSPGSVEVRSSQPVAVTLIRVDDVYWSALPVLPPRQLPFIDVLRTQTARRILEDRPARLESGGIARSE